MYATTRIQVVPRSTILAAMLLAAFAVGGGAGYAAATAAVRTTATTTSVATLTDGLPLSNAAFRASERQGSSENPNAPSGPTNTAFLQSEHTGWIAGVPSNTAFLQSEHVGSQENPTR